MSVISDPVIQKAVANIKQRSEKQRDLQKSIDSFVDFGIIPQIATEKNQIIYGRRGTGKTHLFNYLGAEISKNPRAKVIYIDCRTLGSSSQFSDPSLSIDHRCLALFRDILAEVHDALLERIIDNPTTQSNEVLDLLSLLSESVTNPVSDRRAVSISSKVQTSSEDSAAVAINLSPHAIGVSTGLESKVSSANEQVVTESVTNSDTILFPAISNLLKKICEMSQAILYVLLDE